MIHGKIVRYGSMMVDGEVLCGVLVEVPPSDLRDMKENPLYKEATITVGGWRPLPCLRCSGTGHVALQVTDELGRPRVDAKGWGVCPECKGEGKS